MIVGYVSQLLGRGASLPPIHEQSWKSPSWIGLNWQLIQNWREIKQENMVHVYDVTVIDVTGVQ